MGKLQETANASFDPALNSINGRWGSDPTVKIMDDETYRLIQMDDVYAAVNYTKTITGAFTLRRSLRQPLTDAELITEKQKSLDELRSDRKLRDKVTGFVEKAIKDEEAFYGFNAKEYSTRWAGWPTIYTSYKGSVRFMRSLMEGLKVAPESDYLRALTQNLTDLREDEVSDFIRGPLRTTFRGLRRPKEIGRPIPEPFMSFYATDFKPIRLAIFGAPAAWILPMMFSGDSTTMQLTMLAEIFYVLGYIPMAIGMGRKFDEAVFTEPFRKLAYSNPRVINAVESLGKLDELLSFANYADSLQVPITLPQVVDEPVHSFQARGLRNPALVKANPDYVPNDVNLDGASVTFLTGSNSGGKTALTKTILQAQVLAQAGSYIPAELARIAVADRILYQSRMVNRMQDQEGGFGVEAERTKEIVFGVPRGRFIVGLDDLMGATTFEEGSRHSEDILDGLYTLGGNTIFVTHNHELAESFKRKKRGQFWQVEFADKRPTHKIKPGISTESHSDYVLERIGFTREDIQKHLEGLEINSA